MSNRNQPRLPLVSITKKPLFLICLSLACILLIQGTAGPQPFDDAYITYRYARNLSQGAGFVYNQGEKVLGTTTPLYSLVLAVIARLFDPDILPQASWIISLAADTLNLFLLYRLADWIFKDARAAAIISLAFLLHPFRLNVASGGMETSLFLTALLAMYHQYYLGDRTLLTAVWAAAGVLLRPDAALAVLPLFIAWFIKDRRQALRGAVIATLICLPWILWASLYFGSPIPHSITAKRVTYKNPFGQAAFYLVTFLGTGTIGPYQSPVLLLPGALIALPVLLVGMGFLRKRQPQLLALAAYPLLYCTVMTAVNPAMYFSWYYIPLIPGLLILMYYAVWHLPLKRNCRQLMLPAALAVLLLIVPAYLQQTLPSWPLSRAREQVFWKTCAAVKDQINNQTTILAPDIGVIGWCLPKARIIDPIGLVSPQALPYTRNLPADVLIPPRLITDQQPDLIISLDQFVNPFILEEEFFKQAYQSYYETEVTIVNQTQLLHVFQRQPDS